MKFRSKLLILLLAISLIPLTSISFILVKGGYEEIRNKAEEGLLNLVEAKAEYYDHTFQDIAQSINGVALHISSVWGKGTYYNKSYIWISPDGKGYEKFEEDMKNFEFIMSAFQSIMFEKNEINLMFLGMENGVCFLSDAKVVEKLMNEIKHFDHRERIWYQLAKEKNTTVWTPLYIDVNTGELVTTVSTPVFVNGKFIGVLGSDLLLGTIKNDILDIRFAGSGFPLLVGRDGKIFVHPEYTASGKKWNESFEEENIFDMKGLAEVGDKIKNGITGLELITLHGKKYYAVFSPVNEINGSLLFLLPEEVITKGINEAIKSIIPLLTLVFIGTILAAYLFSLSLTRPIEKLQKATREIAKGNLDCIVDIKGKDEFADLSRDFNKMVEELNISRRALKESEEKYRGIFEESTDVIYITTEDGRLIDINKAGEKLFGYTRDELLKMDVASLYENKEDRERFKREIEKNGFVKDYEVRFRRKDGKIIDCILSTTMIKKGGKTFYQGIIRDVTQIKEARRQLDMYNSLLRHDISNRNQITLGCLELLKEGNLTDEQKKLVEKAYEHLVHSQQLLQKLSIINRVGEKKLKEMDLESVLNKSLEKYEYLSKEKGINIKINLKNKCCVLADDLLENVFSNLIENAIIHSGCKNIEIDVDERDDEVIITIKDDGRGIPKEIADKIFEWGVKGKESKGSGLGLHLVKRIVERYGGKILLKDSQQGTVFEIHLRKC